MSQALLSDLEILSSYRFPQSSSGGSSTEDSYALLDALGPLLLSNTFSTFPWSHLRKALREVFTDGPAELGSALVFPGWKGVDSVIIAFKRLERCDQNEKEEVRDWLEGLVGATIASWTSNDDGTGRVEELLRRLSVPRTFIRVFRRNPAGGIPLAPDAISIASSAVSNASESPLTPPTSHTTPPTDPEELRAPVPPTIHLPKEESPRPLSSPQENFRPMPPPTHTFLTSKPFGGVSRQSSISPPPPVLYRPRLPSPPLAVSTSRFPIPAPTRLPVACSIPRQVIETMFSIPREQCTVANLVATMQAANPDSPRKAKTWEDLIRNCLNASKAFRVHSNIGKLRGRIWYPVEGWEEILLEEEKNLMQPVVSGVKRMREDSAGS